MKPLLFPLFLFPLIISCQQQPVQVTFYKHLDANHKTIALPRSKIGEPAKLDSFRLDLRSGGWKIIVSGLVQGNGDSRFLNSAAKYTLIGDYVSETSERETAFNIHPLAGFFVNSGGKLNFTLVESATGEEVMHLTGSESKWDTLDTVRKMNENAK